MAVPVQRTWTTGEVTTAAQLNANVRDAVNFLLGPPCWHIGFSANQNVADDGFNHVLGFDTEVTDNDSVRNTGTGNDKVTIQTPGRYAGHINIQWNTAAAAGK